MKKFMILMLYVHILTCFTIVICYRILSSAGGADEVVQWFDMESDSPDSNFFEEFGEFNLHLLIVGVDCVLLRCGAVCVLLQCVFYCSVCFIRIY